MRHKNAAALLTFLVAGSGCAPEGGGGTQARVVVRDSAGITIVESPSPLWTASDAWVIDPSPLTTIGAVPFDPERALFRVRDALLISDGQLLVANFGTSELLWFGPSGELEHVAGGRGEGPGELTGTSRIRRCADGRLAVIGGLRLSLFDSTGGFVSAHRLGPASGDPLVWNITEIGSDCSSVLIRTIDEIETPVNGITSFTYRLIWEDVPTNARDTVAEFPGSELLWMNRGGRQLTYPLPWGTGPRWASDGDHVIWGSNQRFETRWHEKGGRLRLISRWSGTFSEITSTDLDIFEELRQAAVEGQPGAGAMYPHVTDFTLPATLPGFDKILIDAVENVWVRAYPKSYGGWPGAPRWDRHEEPESWTVFDATGLWLGHLDAPAGLEVIRIEDDRLIGIWKDELDVEQVRVHRIVRP